ncbi:MAG TPA: phage tail sheath subtilisin-like domain-containing protein [Ottowia sp.]|uniref:phage tail sheath family protein n=1 Tax=Ottowia sp. TaxID=1898956 RepID=UPI002BBBEE5F|nr:phage tail sheath subtilisin-like domain-containing protein [Ottowia sp.]HMN20312.1 phage tail sheath subtilisin-like domain-containing protein [Ottowia sp.]
MPVALDYPGVYIEEMASGVRTIVGVATSVAAFVGFTRKGVPDKAAPVTSFGDFERGYGGLDRDSPVSYAVRQFFANGGTQAIVVRVATGYASAAWTLQDSAPAAVLDVRAASPGAWGNDLRVSVDRTGARNPDAEFNLVILQLQADGVTLAPVETHRNLNLNPASPRYVESVVNSASQRVTVQRRAGLTFNQPGFAVSTSVVFPLTATDMVIAGVANGNTPFRLTLTGSAPNNIAALVAAVNAAIGVAGLGAVLQASDSGADGGAGSGFLRLGSLVNGEASSVVVAGGAFGGLSASIHLGLANGGREFTGNAQHRPANVSNAVPDTKGVDGSRAGPGEIVGSPAAKSGMYALLDVDLFNILCIPETFDMTDLQAAAVIPAAIDLCEKRRAFYIVDAPSTKTLGNIVTWVNGPNGVTRSRNAAVYFPALSLADPLDELRPRVMAPSGTVAGIYARTDANRGVWKAPAGTDATLNGVLDLTLPISDAENGQINPQGVNALRSFPAYGRVVWGARTLKGSDAQVDEYKYVPVRRLALFLEESLYRSTQWVVFEPNDEPLWAQIRLNIGAFLQGLFRQGAFQGRSPREAYFVKCDRETTTQNDINLGIVNILVGFAPLKPAEFVVLKLQQIAGDIPT